MAQTFATLDGYEEAVEAYREALARSHNTAEQEFLIERIAATGEAHEPTIAL